MHSLWDSALLDDQQYSYSEMSDLLRAKATPDQLRKWTTANPADWLNHSAKVRDTLYRTETALSYRYVFDTQKQLEEQLLRGGLNLAAYLNWMFGQR